MNIVARVEKEIKKGRGNKSQTRCNYQEAMDKYQKLLDGGVAVKRKSQLQSISNMPAVAHMR